MHRQADGAGLAGDGPGHALANPPEGIGGKFVAAGGIELFDGPLQAQGTFLNQIEQLQPPALVLLGDADHKPQVGTHHAFLGTAANLDDFSFLSGIIVAPCFDHAHHDLNLIA